MRALDARRSASGGAAADAWLDAAWARLAWRGAAHPGVRTRLGGISEEELLRGAAAAARRGDSREDLGYAMLRLALCASDPVERRVRLDAARQCDLGELAHGPYVLLAHLDLAERRFEALSRDLDAAEVRLPPEGRTLWLVDTYHGLRAQESLQYGLLDVARAHLAEAGDLGSASRDRLWLSYHMAAEDFAAAIRCGEEILRGPPGGDAAEVERLVAVAMMRTLEVPLREDPRPLARLQQALARGGSDEVEARILVDRAFMQTEIGDFAAAADDLRRAAARIDGLGPGTAAELRGALAARGAYLALERGDRASDLVPLRTELLRVCDDMFATWDAIPLRKDGVGFLQFADRRDVIAALVAVECALDPQHPERALAHVMRAQAQGTLARRQDIPVGDAAQVRGRLVPARGGLLVFLPCMFGECVFVVTSARIDFLRMPRAEFLLPELRRLRQFLSVGGELASLDVVTACAERIAGAVLPARLRQEMAAWDACVVVGRELLGNLPFEALPGTRHRWLGCDLALSYLPSLPFGLHRAGAVEERIGLVADRCAVLAVTGGDGVAAEDAVVLAGDSLDAIASPWPRALRFTGQAATAAALAGDDVAHSALAVVVAHGCSGLGTRGDQRTRGVSLAGGPMSCAAIEALREGGVPPLVALAVCRGGSGPLRRGDDAGSHLAGALLFAGADTVVAADADLDAAATMALLAAFSRASAEGCGAAEAMRRARLSLAEDSEFAHPAFHAVVGVFGFEAAAPQRVVRSGAGRWGGAVGLGLLGLGALALVLWSWRSRATGSAFRRGRS
ncbi:MAG: CHAT domain-containing protein [Planctomycetota bacterium]